MRKEELKKPTLCHSCQYYGNKYSFPLPNHLLYIETSSDKPPIKHRYCCCENSKFYGQDITHIKIIECGAYKKS